MASLTQRAQAAQREIVAEHGQPQPGGFAAGGAVTDNKPPYVIHSETKITLSPLAKELAREHGMTLVEMARHILAQEGREKRLAESAKKCLEQQERLRDKCQRKSSNSPVAPAITADAPATDGNRDGEFREGVKQSGRREVSQFVAGVLSARFAHGDGSGGGGKSARLPAAAG